MSVSKRLDTEVIQRLWALYDAAKAISAQGACATVDAWVAFHSAVANVPERARTGKAPHPEFWTVPAIMIVGTVTVICLTVFR